MTQLNVTLFAEVSEWAEQDARTAIEEFGGRQIGSGTMLAGEHSGQRDLEFEVPDERSAEAYRCLARIGFVK
jgi:hypothetical protein